MNSTEKVAVPLLMIQTISSVFLWTLDTLSVVDQRIFALFLGADFLAFALIAHMYVNMKTGDVTKSITVMIWIFAILVLFVAGFVVS